MKASRFLVATAPILVGWFLGETSARADFSGGLALAGFNVSTNNNALGPGTTSFTIGTFLASQPSGSGLFSNVSQYTPFVGGTVTLGTGVGFTITSTTYGTFTETTTPVVQSTTVDPGTGITKEEDVFVLGTFSGGSVGTAIAASLTISFTQDGGSGKPISASGTLSIPAAIVPEPTSATMIGLGLATIGMFSARPTRRSLVNLA